MVGSPSQIFWFVEGLFIEIEHLIAANHQTWMRRRHFNRFQFSQTHGLIANGKAFAAHHQFCRIFIDIRFNRLRFDAGARKQTSSASTARR